MARFDTGQVAISASAQPLSAAELEPGDFILKASASNAAAVYLGTDVVTTSTGFELVPGEEIRLNYTNTPGLPVLDLRPDELFVIGTSGDRVSWIATRR